MHGSTGIPAVAAIERTLITTTRGGSRISEKTPMMIAPTIQIVCEIVGLLIRRRQRGDEERGRQRQVRQGMLEAIDRDERMPRFGFGVKALDSFHFKIIAAIRY